MKRLPPSQLSGMRQMNILLVEDNKDHGFLTKSSFDEHAHNFQLSLASSGLEALETLRKFEFDIIFIDHQLPDMNGLDVMKQIHSLQPDIPIVVTTGRGSEELAVSTFREGAVDYIIKDKNYFNLLPDTALRIHKSKSSLNGKTDRPSFSSQSIYNQVLSTSSSLLDVHASSLMLYNDKKGRLETKAFRGLSHNYLSRVQPKLGEGLAGRAVAESKPFLSSDIDKELYAGLSEFTSDEGIQSAMSIPFTIGNSTRGVLNLYSRSDAGFGAGDEIQASHIVKLSTLALENLKQYRKEHHIAETLQRSHFPRIETEFEGWEIAHRYRVSMEEALLGGDFYDMFPVSGGRHAFVVADVSGKGIEAAAQTAMVKYTLRSYALEDPDPGAVLEKTHHAFCSYMSSEHFVTIFYGVIDPSVKTISYCSAGHPPALFFTAKADKVTSLQEVFMPVGAWHDDVEYNTNLIPFDPGDTLLVYTDGLPDCREMGHKDGAFFGDDNLLKLFSSLTSQKAETMAKMMISKLDQFSDSKMRDDLAFFILRLRPA